MKIILILLLTCSCAIFQKKEISDAQLDDIKTDMAVFNKKLKGYLYTFILKNDLTKLDVNMYLDLVPKRIKPAEAEYKELLDNYSPEIALKTIKSDFIICIKSLKANLILCDKASTGLLDYVSNESSRELSYYLEQVNF